MQLASQTEEPDQTVSPSTYSALINSLFQNPAPLFAGAVMVAFAAAMTAVKTGQDLLWPCVAFSCCRAPLAPSTCTATTATEPH